MTERDNYVNQGGSEAEKHALAEEWDASENQVLLLTSKMIRQGLNVGQVHRLIELILDHTQTDLFINSFDELVLAQGYDEATL